MRTALRIGLVVVAALGGLATPNHASAAAAATWTATGYYTMGETANVPWGYTCGVGKVCFGVNATGGRLTVTVRVYDDHRRRVGGQIAAAENGGWLSLGHSAYDTPFCGTSNRFVLRPREDLTVFLDAPANASQVAWGHPSGCGELRAGSARTTLGATTGRVEVTYSRYD